MTDKTPELQEADDLMMSLMEQRNAALNQAAQLGAQLRGSARRIAGLEEEIAKAKADAAAKAETPADTPVPNGHDTRAAQPAAAVAPPVERKTLPAPAAATAKRKRGRPKKKTSALPPPKAVEATWTSAPMVATSRPPDDSPPTG